jgi:hypothetical protein
MRGVRRSAAAATAAARRGGWQVNVFRIRKQQRGKIRCVMGSGSAAENGASGGGRGSGKWRHGIMNKRRDSSRIEVAIAQQALISQRAPVKQK